MFLSVDIQSHFLVESKQIKVSTISTFHFIFQVAMLDIGAPSVMFVTNSLSDAGSPIKSLYVKSSSPPTGSKSDPTDHNSINSEATKDIILCAMTKDGETILLDGNTGKMLASCLRTLKNSTAICMHIIGSFSDTNIKSVFSYASSIHKNNSILQRTAMKTLKRPVKNQLKIHRERRNMSTNLI